jgi:hypothetical protein
MKRAAGREKYRLIAKSILVSKSWHDEHVGNFGNPALSNIWFVHFS